MNIFIVLVGTLLVANIIGKSKFTSKYIKGKQGEKEVAKFLRWKSGYLVNNIILKTNDVYTQIDHVYITSNCVFVIETKNHSGLICGNETSRKWTAIYGRSKFSMYNPLKQNETHARVIQRTLNIPSNKIVPITIFTNKAVKFSERVNGVYTLEEFKNKFNSIISNRGKATIDSKSYYKALRNLNLSRSLYHQRKQIKFAKTRSGR